LSDFAHFKLKAQTLLYSDFDSYQFQKLKSSQNDEKDSWFYYLNLNDLSIMTNHIESRLGSRVADSSALEFVTYVPSKQPLYIVSNLDNRMNFTLFLKDIKVCLIFQKNLFLFKASESKSNSFLVPRWGGVYIYNSLNEEETLVKADEAVKTFLFHFIDLIGVKLNQVFFDNFTYPSLLIIIIFTLHVQRILKKFLDQESTIL
jgi:hypothetical protein